MDIKKSLTDLILANPGKFVKIFLFLVIANTLVLYTATAYFAYNDYKTQLNVWEGCEQTILNRGANEEVFRRDIAAYADEQIASANAIFVADCFLYYTDPVHRQIKDGHIERLKIDRKDAEGDSQLLYGIITESMGK